MGTHLGEQSIWGLIQSGGFVMYPLFFASLAIWAVIFERLWNFRQLSHGMRSFHVEALNAILNRGGGSADGAGFDALKSVCARHSKTPTAQLVSLALERMGAKDPRLSSRWMEAVERRRQIINQELRSNLWILGTIGSSAPFVGLFGTVVGILKSFQEMAHTGSGGFAVVAAGISESLIATASGIVVAVIAVVAYNSFQTRWSSLVLTVRIHAEEIAELLGASRSGDGH